MIGSLPASRDAFHLTFRALPPPPPPLPPKFLLLQYLLLQMACGVKSDEKISQTIAFLTNKDFRNLSGNGSLIAAVIKSYLLVRLAVRFTFQRLSFSSRIDDFNMFFVFGTQRLLAAALVLKMSTIHPYLSIDDD